MSNLVRDYAGIYASSTSFIARGGEKVRVVRIHSASDIVDVARSEDAVRIAVELLRLVASRDKEELKSIAANMLDCYPWETCGHE